MHAAPWPSLKCKYAVLDAVLPQHLKSLFLENVQMKAIMIYKSKRGCDNGFEVLTCSDYGMCQGSPPGIYKHPWEKWSLTCPESYVWCHHHKAHGACVCAVSG